MSDYGPGPRIQHHWDWRAAGNFIFGGAGSGLLLAAPALPSGPAHAWSLPLGVALVGLGLIGVWTEIGRPLRALHVFFNPWTSWMAREAVAGVALFSATLIAFFQPSTISAWAMAACAGLFAWCQARMLKASKGIPAWREPSIVPFMLATAIAEGSAIALLIALACNAQGDILYGLLAAALVARAIAWRAYCARVLPKLNGAPRAALETVSHTLIRFGTFVSLALLAAASVLPWDYRWPVVALAAMAVVATGWHAKHVIICRTSLNQGFALPALPVRGAR